MVAEFDRSWHAHYDRSNRANHSLSVNEEGGGIDANYATNFSHALRVALFATAALRHWEPHAAAQVSWSEVADAHINSIDLDFTLR